MKSVLNKKLESDPFVKEIYERIVNRFSYNYGDFRVIEDDMDLLVDGKVVSPHKRFEFRKDLVPYCDSEYKYFYFYEIDGKEYLLRWPHYSRNLFIYPEWIKETLFANFNVYNFRHGDKVDHNIFDTSFHIMEEIELISKSERNKLSKIFKKFAKAYLVHEDLKNKKKDLKKTKKRTESLEKDISKLENEVENLTT